MRLLTLSALLSATAVLSADSTLYRAYGVLFDSCSCIASGLSNPTPVVQPAAVTVNRIATPAAALGSPRIPPGAIVINVESVSPGREVTTYATVVVSFSLSVSVSLSEFIGVTRSPVRVHSRVPRPYPLLRLARSWSPQRSLLLVVMAVP